MTTGTSTATATATYRVWIRADAGAVWAALTDPEQLGSYGYRGRVELDLRPGGAYRVNADEQMLAFGAPPVMVDCEVLEVESERRLVFTWRALWDEQIAAEPATRVAYELEPLKHGVTKVTLTHEVEGAPITAAIVSGAIADAGGGWGWILSDLKSLLETGAALPPQMG